MLYLFYHKKEENWKKKSEYEQSLEVEKGGNDRSGEDRKILKSLKVENIFLLIFQETGWKLRHDIWANN